MHTAKDILKILDKNSQNFRFPILDNGYLYLAASRLSLFRSATDWGMVIEVFGFSPRAALPDLMIYTFASTVDNRNSPESYTTLEAYQDYLTYNPYNEMHPYYPIEDDAWMDVDNPEMTRFTGEYILRGKTYTMPTAEDYQKSRIILEKSQPQTFEFCRYLAETKRELVLATKDERSTNIPSDMKQILQLEDWHHPNLAEEELPSQNETFQQLAKVLETGDISHYTPTQKPNTHWSNWPEGGLL